MIKLDNVYTSEAKDQAIPHFSQVHKASLCNLYQTSTFSNQYSIQSSLHFCSLTATSHRHRFRRMEPNKESSKSLHKTKPLAPGASCW